jgi:hypothetical protein
VRGAVQEIDSDHLENIFNTNTNLNVWHSVKWPHEVRYDQGLIVVWGKAA